MKATFMRPSDLTRDLLTTLYTERNMTMREIAATCKISVTSVRTYLLRFNIPIRPAYPRNAKGAHNANWRGGTRISSRQYRLLRLPDHPNAQADGYVAEHIFVALQASGRPYLAEDECVHHINFDKLDNRPENLYICPKTQHTEYHARLEQLTAQLLRDGLVVFHPERGYERKAG